MTTNPYPFGTYARELFDARGRKSSREFDQDARELDAERAFVKRQVAQHVQRIAELDAEQLELIGKHPEQREEIETIAHKLKSQREELIRFGEQLLTRLESRARAARRFAEEAREFEARWNFNPYKDPLLDSLERANKKTAALPVPRNAGRKKRIPKWAKVK